MASRYERLAKLQDAAVETLDEDQVVDLINNFEDCWDLTTHDYRHSLELGYRQYIGPDGFDANGLPSPETMDIKAIHTNKSNQCRFLTRLRKRITELKIGAHKSIEDGSTLSQRLGSIIKQGRNGFENVRRHYNCYAHVKSPTVQPDYKSFADAYTIDDDDEDGDTEKLNPYAKCVIVTLNEAESQGYRRYKGQCYREIKTSGGYHTRAWSPACTIDSFVHSIASKDDAKKIWNQFLMKPSMFRDVIQHMSTCTDNQFPEIKKNRHLWSFNNGVFQGKWWNPEKGEYGCRFLPYESKEFHGLDPLLISCKYFDTPFNAHMDIERWQDIPTPHFDTILKFQEFEDEVCNWAFALGGRLCFELGDLDRWQVIPFFKGIANSGKSTIIKVFEKFYEHDDVGILSNNIERKFGLSMIMNTFMFTAPEVKADLALEQAEFQSIVTGEKVSVAVKNKRAETITWTSPGALAGNELPSWKDNSGSIIRRILPWNFSKQVKNGDPMLDDKLDMELPTILLKCVRGYLEYANKFRGQFIWNVIPEYFTAIQKQVAMVANALHNFLDSTNVVMGKDLFVPQKLFVQSYHTHCRCNNLGQQKFNPDSYGGPFSTNDIQVRSEAVTYKGRAYPVQPILFGVDIIEDDLGMMNNNLI
jgi:hypothetical protein